MHVNYTSMGKLRTWKEIKNANVSNFFPWNKCGKEERPDKQKNRNIEPQQRAYFKLGKHR